MRRTRQGLWCTVALASACRQQPSVPVVPARPPTAAQALADTFSPDVVGTIVASPPRAGDYTLQLGLAFDSFPTPELHLSTRRTGVVRLTLGADGTARGCVGVRSEEIVAGQWKYERDPTKRKHHEDTQVQLVALRGTWRKEDGVAVVGFDHVGWSTCEGEALDLAQDTTELRCIALTGSDRVPKESLACKTNPRGLIHDLGMPMTREPPRDVGRPAMSAPSGTELLLGAPGLVVDVEQDARAQVPSFKVRAAAVTLDEAAYRPAPVPSPKKP
jgi:hypothetical protein